MTQATGDLPDWITQVGGSSALLFNAAIPLPGAVLEVAQYQSLEVIIYNQDQASFYAASYMFSDNVSGLFADTGLLSADANGSVGGDSYPVWTLPVRGDTFTLTNTSGGALFAQIIGRPYSVRKGMSADYYPARHFQASIPASSPSNTRVQLPGQDGNAPTPIIRDCSNYNGQCTALVLANGAITGQIQCTFRDKAGAQQRIAIASNPGIAVQQFQFGHPDAFVSWSFNTAAISPSSPVVVSLTLIPSE